MAILAIQPERSKKVDVLFDFEQSAKSLLIDNPDIDIEDYGKQLSALHLLDVPASAYIEKIPYDEGHLFFTGGFDDDNCADWQMELLMCHMNIPKHLEITIHLNSGGGYVSSGFGLIATVKHIRASGRKINVHVDSEAMSMAGALVQAADHRSMSDHAFMMLHKISYGIQGSTDDHQDQLQQNERVNNQLYKMYADRTGTPLEVYTSILRKRNWYLSPQEALEAGFIDEIVSTPPYVVTQGKLPKYLQDLVEVKKPTRNRTKKLA